MRWVFYLESFGSFSESALAGFLEIGATSNYRRTSINEDNFQESLSYTASVSYYFWDQSAIELSYTDGYSRIVTANVGDIKRTTETEFEMIGADLVFGFGARDAVLQPYVKLGGAYISREIAFTDEGFGTSHSLQRRNCPERRDWNESPAL